MHPYTAQWLAEDRMAEAHRAAARARLTALARSTPTAARRHSARKAVGGWLIAAGTRLLDRSPVVARRV